MQKKLKRTDVFEDQKWFRKAEKLMIQWGGNTKSGILKHVKVPKRKGKSISLPNVQFITEEFCIEIT